MTELPKQSLEQLSAEQLTARVYALREAVTDDMGLLIAWQDAVANWDADFKTELVERFGDTRYAQQVAAWQALVGGTVESETDITEEQRKYINTSVEQFMNSFIAEHEVQL